MLTALRALREALGVSAEDVAGRMEMGVAWVRGIEEGRLPCTCSAAAGLTRAALEAAGVAC